MPIAITTPTRISFRQGIVSYPVSGSAQSFMVKTGTYVSLRASGTPVEVAFAHRDTDYWLSETQDLDNVWGPIPANTDCWLYWDIDMLSGARTFGFTMVEPQYGPTQVPGVADQHWYDTSEMQMKVYVNGKYTNVIRVFAGKVINSTFAPLGVGFPLRPYAGSQIEQYIGCTPGHIIVDSAGSPIRRDNGTFFTTESEFFFNGSSINPVRLEATVVTGEAQETMAKYQVVKFSDFGKLNLAEYDDVSSTMIAMLMEDLTWQEVGNVCIQGKITNPLWNWPTVGASLWVSTSGQLTDVDPHVSNAFVYPIGRPPVGRVITPNTIIFDQGLGGKGDRGEPGPTYTGAFANLTTYGIARFATQPTDLNDPIAVGDNDPRLSNKVLKAGDSMTGPLVLSANPVVPLGAATKQYVDVAVSSIDLSSRVAKSGDTMTGQLRTPSVAASTITTDFNSGSTNGNVTISQSNLTPGRSGRVYFTPPSGIGFAGMVGYVDATSGQMRYGAQSHAFDGSLSIGTSTATPSDGTGTYTAALTFTTAGGITINSSSGTAGQFLTSQGIGQPVAWTTLNAARLDTYNVFTKGHSVTPVTLTDAVTVAIDASLSNNFTLVMNNAGATRQIANPTNLQSGQVINLRISQDAVGGRSLTFGSMWKWGNGTVPTFAAGPNAINFISAYYDGTLDVLIASAVTGLA